MPNMANSKQQHKGAAARAKKNPRLRRRFGFLPRPLKVDHGGQRSAMGAIKSCAIAATNRADHD
jgi:hypothetical protein